MKLLAFIIALLFSAFSFAQSNRYKQLPDFATDMPGVLFVSAEPIKSFKLDQKEMSTYIENFADQVSQKPDTVLLSQIIRNSKSPDTTTWENIELSACILVTRRDEKLSKDRLPVKINAPKDDQIKFYKRQINEFNSSDPKDRNIFYFSKPVFDDSKTFAVIQWENGHSGLGGGGGITLYQLKEATWKKVCSLNNWKY